MMKKKREEGENKDSQQLFCLEQLTSGTKKMHTNWDSKYIFIILAIICVLQQTAAELIADKQLSVEND